MIHNIIFKNLLLFTHVTTYSLYVFMPYADHWQKAPAFDPHALYLKI